jgi:hypothetical protein
MAGITLMVREGFIALQKKLLPTFQPAKLISLITEQRNPIVGFNQL